jgi:hypothetical protein
MSIQIINDCSLVTRLETAHSEPEISNLEDEIDEGYITIGASPMSITPESHSPSAVKRREDLKIDEFPSSLLSSPETETTSRRVPQQQQQHLTPTTSNSSDNSDSFYKPPSNNTLKLPPFAQFISNRTA